MKLDEIILKLEENAEDENYHDLCGMYQKLADIVKLHGGAVVARKVMLDILENYNGFM